MPERVDQPRLSDKVVDFGHFGHEVAEIRLVDRAARWVTCQP